jgi:general secretion pathway protein I
VSRRGFTLVEVLVAMVITAAAIVLISQGFSVGVNASASSQQLTRAVMLAESKMAEFETGELPLTTAPSGDFKPDHPAFKFTTKIDTDSFEAYRVTVTITWNDRGTEQSYNLVRILTERPTAMETPR